MSRKTEKDKTQMGMAASQARLLSLTSRMHDVELKAQKIQAAKLDLATQEDEVYEKYCEAMDATKFQVFCYRMCDGSKQYMDANFNTMCTYNPDFTQQYALKNNRTGRILVQQSTYDKYQENQNDRFAFAWAMMGSNYEEEYDNIQVVGMNIADENLGSFLLYQDANPSIQVGSNGCIYMSDLEATVYDLFASDNLREKFNAINEACGSGGVSGEEWDLAAQAKALKEFRVALYEELGKEIFQAMNVRWDEANPTDFDAPEFTAEYFNDIVNDPTNQYIEGLDYCDYKSEFSYYARLWDIIHNAGGCEVMNPDFSSNDQKGTDWLTNMVNACMVTIVQTGTTNCGSSWNDVNISTSIGTNYLSEVPDDDKAKKAEVEYEHAMKLINRKDTKYDTLLKNLETEENALKTERDALESVIKDNSERNFKIFS